MNKPKSLFDQLSEGGRGAVACLCGFHNSDCAGYRNALRDIEPLPDGFTIGDATRVYLLYQLTRLARNI